MEVHFNYNKPPEPLDEWITDKIWTKDYSAKDRVDLDNLGDYFTNLMVLLAEKGLLTGPEILRVFEETGSLVEIRRAEDES